MGARVCAEMENALRLVRAGKTVRQAAALAGVTVSAIYKALKRIAVAAVS